MKKSMSILLSMALLLALAAPAATAKADTLEQPTVKAAAAVVMDYETGDFLYEKDADTMRVPASMTKIMTAYIVFQELDAGNITKETEFTISDKARRISRDSSYPAAVLLVGSTITVDKMLQLMMIPSACGACVVAAENISGSEEEFVKRMNETAEELGMEAAYENCHGGRPHYITARSIAILIRTFIQEYPEILDYTSMTSMTYNGRTYSNTNKLLPGKEYEYEGADGFKTGTISESGYCLASTAIRDGRRIIAVVMKSTSTKARNEDSHALLDYGFAEMARRDAINAVEVELTAEHALRVGGNVNVKAVFSNVTLPFDATFTLSLDGVPVASFEAEASDGLTLEAVTCLDESYIGKDSAVLSLTYVKPDGHTASFEKELAVSDEAAPAFRDVAYHWSEGVVGELADKGVLKGGTDGLFRPDAAITRAEFAAMAARAAGLTAPEDYESPYTDIENHWAEQDILALSAAGVQYWTEETFLPNTAMTREEAAAITAKLLNLEDNDGAHFTDSEEISEKARAAIEAMADAWILHGYEDGTFRPFEPATRAQCASMLMALFRDESEESGTEEITDGADEETGEEPEPGDADGGEADDN